MALKAAEALTASSGTFLTKGKKNLEISKVSKAKVPFDLFLGVKREDKRRRLPTWSLWVAQPQP